MSWTPERDAELRRLAALNLTASVIAKRLSAVGPLTTRAAVIGRAWREGIALANTSIIQFRENGRQSVEARRVRARVPVGLAPGLMIVVDEGHLVGAFLMDLEPATCRWPVGPDAHGADQLFCGAPALSERPYCSEHHQRAWEAKPQPTQTWTAWKTRGKERVG